jgi:hypothetical protein
MTITRPRSISGSASELPMAELLEHALDELGSRLAAAGHGPSGMRVAEVLDDRHPALAGRVRIAGPDERPVWVPTLQGLAVRRGDRVLVARPAGIAEPVVVGVLDGYRPRATEPVHAHAIELRPDEALAITAADGRPLLEVLPSDTGPVLRLSSPDLTLDVPGTLRVLADELELRARDGAARIEARNDVEIKGEVIHLN